MQQALVTGATSGIGRAIALALHDAGYVVTAVGRRKEALSDLQQLNLLRNAMDRLDTRCRELLLMVFCDESQKLSYDEVARRLGSPVGSIGPTRSRCLDKLRTLAS